MLLSRFWYVILAVAAAAGTAAALLAQSVINGRSDEALADNLARDRVVVEAMMRLEARARLDRIAFITVDSKLGGLLRQARDITDEKKLREVSGQVRDILRGHVSRIVDAAGDEGSAADKRRELEPDIAFALDGNGRIIAQLGPLEANPPGASLATFPLIKRALQGYVRDNVWMYDRRIYRMAARPVMAGSEYGGVIVHGYRLEKGLTEKLAKNLDGATLAFFHGNDVLGVHIPDGVAGAPQQAELASVLPKMTGGDALASGASKELTELQNGGRATFMLVAGAAAANGVGYAIARPRKLVGSPEELFQQASQDDVKALPLPLLIGGAVLLALVGLLSIYVERDRHMKQLMKKTAEIGGGTRDRLVITEWSGAYRKLADRINQAIDKEVEKAGERAPSMRKKANLDELLGHNPEASVTPFFGFAADGDARGADASPASPPPAAPLPAARPKPSPAPAAAAQPKPVLAAVPAPAPAPAASPARANGPQGAPPAIPVAAAPSPARVPAVRAASQPLAMPSIAPAVGAGAATGAENGADFDEVAHHREVYQQYLETRRKCGEPVDNLTYDKFGVTLRKTRDQILQKHDARAVRFTVQVKEGKAALKAQPIKR